MHEKVGQGRGQKHDAVMLKTMALLKSKQRRALLSLVTLHVPCSV